ncbi:15832_t:CDS:2 [Dentiscutata erythropus]|uniref:15832_t:CDS:1 n=1 Tax=Dentiscutata erythropus TaxID=1348616 RepID=A0A9N8ZNC0_9GLOM|nr:15832_t:CDS:2 [Dentiscutata erythropus]
MTSTIASNRRASRRFNKMSDILTQIFSGGKHENEREERFVQTFSCTTMFPILKILPKQPALIN